LVALRIATPTRPSAAAERCGASTDVPSVDEIQDFDSDFGIAYFKVLR